MKNPEVKSNYTDGLRRKYFRGISARIYSFFHRDILVIDETGIFRNHIFLNGHIIGYENEQWGNLIIDWRKMKKANKKLCE